MAESLTRSLLSYSATELAEEADQGVRSHAPEQKWSVRNSVLFIIAASLTLWALIILGIREII